VIQNSVECGSHILVSYIIGVPKFCAIDPFKCLVKPRDPFWEKCISMHKLKYIGLESVSLYYTQCYKLYYEGH